MINYRTKPNPNLRVFIVFGDVIFITFAFFASYVIRIIIYEGNDFSELFRRLSILLPAAVLLHILIFYIFELYSIDSHKLYMAQLVWIITSTILATFFIISLFYFFPKYRMGSFQMTIHIPLLVVCIFLWRKCFFHFIIDRYRFSKNVIWIDFSGSESEKVDKLVKKFKYEYSLIGSVAIQDDTEIINLNEIEIFDSLDKLVFEKDIDVIVLSENPKKAPLLKKHLIDFKFKGIEIYDYPTFYQKIFSKIPIMDIKGSFFLFSNQQKSFQPYIYIRLKRVFDIVLSVSGLILAFPLILLSAIAIKMTSDGSIFFKQERLGLNAKPFTLLKFRTMIENAEDECGPKRTYKGDPRITKVGKFLRSTHIDEIPQMLNVFKGEMSFVGPRPFRKHFVDILAEEFPFYKLRLSMKPGITGWAQVKGDHERNYQATMECLEYDLFYIMNHSTFMDILILLKTITTILFRRGE